MVAAGRSTKDIASTLGISARTVDFHRSNIQLKTGLHSVASLTRYVMENEEALARVGHRFEALSTKVTQGR
jgi:DNA-binding CsgD family transcriptional regulator